MADLQWFMVEGRAPKWARSAAIDADGTVWVPAVVAGSEMAVFLCAGYDGTKALVVGKHAYYPSEWVKREFPDARELVEKIERRLKQELPGAGTS